MVVHGWVSCSVHWRDSYGLRLSFVRSFFSSLLLLSIELDAETLPVTRCRCRVRDFPMRRSQ